MGDTFELDQGDRETLRGTLHVSDSGFPTGGPVGGATGQATAVLLIGTP